MARKTIAILGGGLGSLAAAYALTNDPRWASDYHVDVYQKGWRLGGKGASGRGENKRIEEHGLHCFWGFYDNAFGMLRKCYGELGRQKGFVTVDDAFIGLDYVHFIDQLAGEWCRYKMHFPKGDGRPGESNAWPTVAELGMRALQRIREALREPGISEPFDAVLGGARAHESIATLEDAWTRGSNARPTTAFRLAAAPPPDHREALALLGRLTSAAPPHVTMLARVALADPEAEYRKYVLQHALKLAFFILKGLLSDGVPTSLDAFAEYDDYDLKKWLAKHGAGPDVLESPVVIGFYNASFCHPRGDFRDFDLAAGVSMRAILLMGFTYKGSFMWKMRAGMGDVVFAPLYEALAKRGVAFHFFHKVSKLSLDASGTRVGSIALDVQACVKSGRYEPLEIVDDLPCWPAKPDYAQLEGGDALRDVDFESDWSPAQPWTTRTLALGTDYDLVVCGIPVLALGRVASELVDASPAWKRMVDNVKTVRTKSVQVWLRDVGEQRAWLDENHVMTDVYKDDFNSVADMYQTLDKERWPERPAGVVYFSTPMADDPNEPPVPDASYPSRQNALVREEWDAWVAKWKEGIFGWTGDLDALAVYSRANIDADERYTLSVAGSTKHRLRPDGSGFANLFLAGDWTKSPLDLGCAENATMSGLIAGAAAAKAARAQGSAARFVEYLGMPVFPPPYRQRDLTLCQLALPADPSAMQGALDRWLNPAAGAHRFRVLGRWVLLQTGFIRENRGAAPDAAFGTASETSATFLVPCARWRGGTAPLEVGFFAPIIFVDHPLSLVAGREVLGMAKHLATFEGSMPEKLADTAITAPAVATLGDDSPIVPTKLIEVRPAARGEPRSPLPWRVASEALSSAGSVLEKLVSARTITFFSLRQLRDVRDASLASTSDITRGRLRVGSVQLDRLPQHVVTLADVASHPIARSLGLANGPIASTLGLKIRIDEATLDVEP